MSAATLSQHSWENPGCSQMTTLITIPLEILLLILRELDTVDVIRLGMTCRGLHESTQTHHVWLDQTQNHRQRTVALRLSVPSPTTLTTEALKRFAILQAKLRIRWNRSPGRDDWEKLQFAASGTTLLPGRLDLHPLPGGELVVSVDEIDGSISLRRIKLSDGQLSLIRLVDISGGEHDKGAVVWIKLLPAMAPHPVLSYARVDSVYLFGITPDGRANFGVKFPTPKQSELLWVCGQGRIAGFLFQPGSGSPLITIIHLDHPGVSLEIPLPSDCADLTEDLFVDDADPLRFAFESWKVCLPTPDLAVIYGGDHLLAYSLPPFTTLPRGNLRLEEGPTWRLSSILKDSTGARRWKASTEVFYEPSLHDHQFNIHLLHLICQLDDFDPQTYLGLITLKIDPSNLSSSPRTPVHQRIVKRFPINGLIASGSLYPEIYHSRTRSDSEGLDVWVVSLEGISSSQANEGGEGEGSLYMFVSNDELEPDLEWESVGLDEASGRVFIWGPTYRWMTSSETRIFVGELVS